jgi:tetratricopeptide (TPR) repeat protein
MPIRRVAVFLLAALALMGHKADAADWTRLRSANFTIEGDVSEGELREVALRFEQFREVLRRLMPNARLVTRTPLTVVVFAYDREFKAVQPLYQGKPIDSDGYATVTPFGTAIALSLQKRDAAYPLIYHEYGHLLISDALPGAPLWVEEGLAEYYRTFTLSADMKSAVVGLPLSAGELNLLRGRRLLPMSDLLAADHDSKMYNVGADRQRFYVECWALVHYLEVGSKTRQGQFHAYLNSIARGVPPQTALAQTIPDIGKLETEVSDYLDQPVFVSTRHTSSRGPLATEGSYQSARMTRADAEATVGRLLAEQQRYDEATARLNAALKLDPGSGSALVGLGLIDLMQGRPLDALPRLRQGASLSESDAMAHFALGMAASRCESPECAKQAGLPETARAELARAVELAPEFPDALSFLGFAELAAGADLSAAERHLEAAIAFLPGREDYRLHLAQVYMRERDFSKAQELLGPVAAASPFADLKAAARQLLGQLAAMKNADLGREQMAASAVAAAGDRPPSAEAGASSEATAIPVYRRPGEDERRLEGILESILCPTGGGIIVVVRDNPGAHRFWAPSFDAIDFITYRSDLTGRVSCGPQAGAMRVYATSRPAAKGEAPLPQGIEGRVNALEYLPKGK